MDLLTDLNDEQRRAVELTDGALLVLAGAGSGKTRVLVHRIAYSLATGKASPDEIVAVTFTNKAAGEMKGRVAQLLGRGSAPDRVGTFHSLCLRMLRREARLLGYRDGFQVFDSDDSLRLSRECLREAVMEDAPSAARDLLHRISAAKNLGLTPSAAEEAWHGHLAPGYARAYRAYEEALRRMNAMDFDDLILNVLILFEEHPDRRSLWSGSCRYLLVDEYQDTNPPQYRLVRSLSSVHGNLCVVGDEDQSIYRFRGADIGNILSFQKDFPGAAVVKLTRNYRSTGAILEAANALVRHNKSRIGKDLWTDAGGGEPVGLAVTASDREEASFVLGRILEWRRTGPLEEAAVLYRTNAQSRLFEEAFIRAGVPYRIFGGLRFYDRKEIRDLMAYLRVALNPDDDVSFRRVINVPPRGMGPAALEAVASHAAGARSLHKGLLKALESGLLPARAAVSARAFLALLASVRARSAAGPPVELVRSLVKDLDYEEYLRRTEGPEAESRLENVRQLIVAASEADGPEGLQGFLDRASLVSDTERTVGDRGVNLMTLHSAKGLEFDLVFLAGMEEGLSPHSRTLESDGEIEEERRLCYVGMTRARRRLYLTAAGTRRGFGEVSETRLSRFLAEIGPERLEGTTGLSVGAIPLRGRTWGGTPRAAARRREEVSLGEEDVSRHGDDEGEDSPPVGATVRHEQFGVGKVLCVEAAAEGPKVTVRFSGGTRKILTRYARLSRVRR